MPVFDNPAVAPRQELNYAIVEGEGAVSNLIGEMAMPSFPINRRTAHIIKATIALTNGLRVIDDDRFIHAPGTEFERQIATFTDDTMTVTLRGVEIVVPNEVQLDYAGFLQVEAFETGRFGQTVALTKEKLVAAQVFNTTNTGAGSATNSTVAYTVANLSTISFIADVIAATRAVKALGERADTVAMSGPVYERIRQAATVQAYVAGTLKPGQEADKTTILGALREYGITELLIGDSYYNNAAGTATTSLSQVWSNTYVAVFKRGTLSGMSDATGISVPQLGGLGVNTYWEGFGPGGVPTTNVTAENAFSSGTFIESYPEFKTNSMVIRCKMSHKPYIANVNTAYLIATQYS